MKKLLSLFCLSLRRILAFKSFNHSDEVKCERCGWFLVRVRLRQANKNMAWQTRAIFLLEAEAIDYVQKWEGIAQAEIIKLQTGDL